MKSQSGKTPLGWIITIVVALIIGGVTVAMLFADSELISEIQEKIVQTQNK